MTEAVGNWSAKSLVGVSMRCRLRERGEGGVHGPKFLKGRVVSGEDGEKSCRKLTGTGSHVENPLLEASGRVFSDSYDSRTEDPAFGDGAPGYRASGAWNNTPSCANVMQ